eukprot:scaffold262000_cov23-Tisochrysis_lutea.AAC.3
MAWTQPKREQCCMARLLHRLARGCRAPVGARGPHSHASQVDVLLLMDHSAQADHSCGVG